MVWATENRHHQPFPKLHQVGFVLKTRNTKNNNISATDTKRPVVCLDKTQNLDDKT